MSIELAVIDRVNRFDNQPQEVTERIFLFIPAEELVKGAALANRQFNTVIKSKNFTTLISIEILLKNARLRAT